MVLDYDGWMDDVMGWGRAEDCKIMVLALECGMTGWDWGELGHKREEGRFFTTTRFLVCLSS